jgi:Universal stress protein family
MEGMFKRMLVPLDGSERAEQALPVAAHMARGAGGSVILLQVVDVATFSRTYLAHPSMIENHIETSLDAWAKCGLQRWVMGSVTEGVLTKTRLPLLVVRPTDATDKSHATLETQEREFPLTRPGAVAPRHYMMAIIDDVKEAQDAVQALRHADIPAEDIRLFERHEIIEYAEHTERTRNLRSRIADVFQAFTSDEDAHVLIYVEEALRGHAILNVYAPTFEQAERVKAILVDHHTRIIKYFGRWAITVLHH